MLKPKIENMSRQFVKFLVLVLSLMLLYYGVAWSVLRCSHDEDAVHEATLLNGDPVHLDLECVGPNLHTETLAAASSVPQGDRLMLRVTRSVNDFLTLHSQPGDAESDVWLRAVFEMSPSLAFLIGLPSYLFLSVLRI